MSLFNLSVVAFDESPFLVTSSRSPSRSTLYHESEVFYFSSSSHYPCHLVLSSSPHLRSTLQCIAHTLFRLFFSYCLFPLSAVFHLPPILVTVRCCSNNQPVFIFAIFIPFYQPFNFLALFFIVSLPTFFLVLLILFFQFLPICLTALCLTWHYSGSNSSTLVALKYVRKTFANQTINPWPAPVERLKIFQTKCTQFILAWSRVTVVSSEDRTLYCK